MKERKRGMEQFQFLEKYKNIVTFNTEGLIIFQHTNSPNFSKELFRFQRDLQSKVITNCFISDGSCNT